MGPEVLVLLRFTQALYDSSESKYGKNALELAQPWSWLNPPLFSLALFVAIGICSVKLCYSSLTGVAGKAMTGRTYLAQLPARGFVKEIKRTLERITTRSMEAFGHTGAPNVLLLPFCHQLVFIYSLPQFNSRKYTTGLHGVILFKDLKRKILCDPGASEC